MLAQQSLDVCDVHSYTRRGGGRGGGVKIKANGRKVDRSVMFRQGMYITSIACTVNLQHVSKYPQGGMSHSAKWTVLCSGAHTGPCKCLPALLAVVLWEEAVCDKHSASHEDENSPGSPNQDINHAL